MITSLGEQGAGLCASRAVVCLYARLGFCHFSLPLCRGLTAVCGGGTPWTFLLTFVFHMVSIFYVISRMVSGDRCGIRLYRFLIIAFSSNLKI